VVCLSVSEEDDSVALALTSRSVRVYSLSRGVLLQEFPQAHNDNIWAIDHNNRVLATASWDKTAGIWRKECADFERLNAHPGCEASEDVYGVCVKANLVIFFAESGSVFCADAFSEKFYKITLNDCKLYAMLIPVESEEMFFSAWLSDRGQSANYLLRKNLIECDEGEWGAHKVQEGDRIFLFASEDDFIWNLSAWKERIFASDNQFHVYVVDIRRGKVTCK